MVSNRSPALLLLLFLFLTGWGFSAFSGEAVVNIPYNSKYNLVGQIVSQFNTFPKELPPDRVKPVVSATVSSLENLKNARYIVAPLLASRGNFYILGASLIGSALIDYLIDYLNQQEQAYFQAFPDPSCQRLVGYSCNITTKTICNGSGGDISCIGLDIATITGWKNDGTGGCFATYDVSHRYLKQGECVTVMADPTGFLTCTGNYFLPNTTPADFLACPNQPKKDPPPFVFQPVSPDAVANLIPAGDYTASFQFPDSPNIKTPQDISPPISAPDGSVYDIPNYSPDGRFSPDYTDPNNPVPDIPISDPNVRVNYHITDPTTNQSHDYSDKPVDNSSLDNKPKEDYSYNPTNPDLDTNIDKPEKKDLQGLITSNINSIKNRFSFDSGCSGGTCSFNIDVFGHSTVLDFCQFADVFSMIGTIILTFSYFYAFFIITKGG